MTEAVLVPAENGGSVWKLTFSPQSLSGDYGADHKIRIALSPEGIDNMFFAITYTREEIVRLERSDG